MESINVSGIKVMGGGLKGLEVNYVKQETDKKGKEWLNDYWQGRKVPIGDELEKVIKSFRYYLLDVYGYDLEDVNVGDVEITEVNFGNGWFVIKGDKRGGGDKHLKLKTYKVTEEDEYEKYVEVENLIGQLKAEVKDYMEGNSVMSNDQLVMRFYQDKGKATDEFKANFEAMSDKEKEEEATRILEKMGHLVILNSEVNGVDEVSGSEEVNGDGYSISDVEVVEKEEVKPGVNSTPFQIVVGEENVTPDVPAGNVVPMFGAPVVPAVDAKVEGEVNVTPTMDYDVNPANIVVPNFDVVPVAEVVKDNSFGKGIADAFREMEDNEEVFTITPIRQS